MNFKKMWFPWKPVDVQLGTISENSRIGDFYQCAKFYACIKKYTICLKFRVLPPDYSAFYKNTVDDCMKFIAAACYYKQ